MAGSDTRLFDAHFFDIDGCLATRDFNERYELLLKALLQRREQWFLETLRQQLTSDELKDATPTADLLNKIIKIESDFQARLYTDFRAAVQQLLLHSHATLFNSIFKTASEVDELFVGSVSNRMDLRVDKDHSHNPMTGKRTPSVTEFLLDVQAILLRETRKPVELVPLLSDLLHPNSKIGDRFEEIQRINEQSFHILTTLCYTDQDDIEQAEKAAENAAQRCKGLARDAEKHLLNKTQCEKTLAQKETPFYRSQLEQSNAFLAELPEKTKRYEAEKQQAISQATAVRAEKDPIIQARRQLAADLLGVEHVEQGTHALLILEKLSTSHATAPAPCEPTLRMICDEICGLSEINPTPCFSAFSHHRSDIQQTLTWKYSMLSQALLPPCAQSSAFHLARSDGDTSHLPTKPQYPISDRTKTSIYFQITHLVQNMIKTRYPDAAIGLRSNIYDDLCNLLADANALFSAHPALLPEDCSTALIAYAGEAPEQKHALVGKGPTLALHELKSCMMAYHTHHQTRLQRKPDFSAVFQDFLLTVNAMLPHLITERDRLQLPPPVTSPATPRRVRTSLSEPTHLVHARAPLLTALELKKQAMRNKGLPAAPEQPPTDPSAKPTSKPRPDGC